MLMEDVCALLVPSLPFAALAAPPAVSCRCCSSAASRCCCCCCWPLLVWCCCGSLRLSAPRCCSVRALRRAPEGVIVTKKDHTMTKHPQIEVPNLHVCKLMQSLRSREVVKEKFNWCVRTTTHDQRGRSSDLLSGRTFARRRLWSGRAGWLKTRCAVAA